MAVPSDHDLSSASFAAIARALSAPESIEDTLRIISTLAVDVIEGCSSAGVSLYLGDGRITTAVASDPIVEVIDRIQAETGEGPCVDAITSTYVDHSGLDEPRWPLFTARAAEAGIRSVLAYRLFVLEDTLGSLNLYGETQGAFDDNARVVAAVFATHASLALAGTRIGPEHLRTVEGLKTALWSRDVIGQAKGILMEQRGISAEAAFEVLIATSQRLNIKLRTVADQLALTGHLPRSD